MKIIGLVAALAVLLALGAQTAKAQMATWDDSLGCWVKPINPNKCTSR